MTVTETKSRPILFSSPMVRAILAGTKTQTRRVVRGVNGVGDDLDWRDMPKYALDRVYFENGWAVFEAQTHIDDTSQTRYPCPYGRPGDLLWVRETWNIMEVIEDTWAGGYDLDDWRGPIPKNRPRSATVGYRADSDDYDAKWRPSIFMPRWASRITLEITGVRVERVQAITEEDADAEGVEWNTSPMRCGHTNGVSAFKSLWDQINGKRPGCSWEEDPWVWVVSFRPAEGGEPR